MYANCTLYRSKVKKDKAGIVDRRAENKKKTYEQTDGQHNMTI